MAFESLTTTLPILEPQLIAGLETSIKGNIDFLSDDEVVYPVGSVVAIHNFNVKKQKYIKLNEKGKNLTHIAVSPNKKLIAIVEATEKCPVVTLWCAKTYKKKKALVLPTDKDTIATRYVAVDFTFNSKHVIAVTGEPDWSLYCFRCDQGRLESSARANNANNTGTVVQVACNPNDANQLVVIGNSVLRCLGCTEYTWRQFGYNKFDSTVYTSCCWLSHDRLMVGSSKGKILILETGEVRATFHAMDLPIINVKLKDELQQSSQASTKYSSSNNMNFMEDENENYEIRSIINFPRGFAFGFMNGKIHLYERETEHVFRKRTVFRIPDQALYREYNNGPKQIKTTVNCIKVNSAQDHLIATCNETQIYQVKLWLQLEGSSPNEFVMEEYGYPLHLGPIGSMSICRWKPICVTSGTNDRSLKIWNYETNEIELIQNFQDDIHSVALHPTGLYCVIGFSDKLRYMTILIDDIVTTKEFNIRSCKLCSFSTMGHVFASTNCSDIFVYSSISFVLMYILKGHLGQVRCMSWNKDDRLMTTCGSEGAVYVWDVCEATRISETIIKTNPFTAASITKSGKETYAVGNDGHIRELISSNVQRDVVLVPPTAGLDAIVLSQLDTMLFVAGNQGSVYSVKMPLLEKAEFIEFTMHKRIIVEIYLSYDDRYLITGAIDGSVCFWKVGNSEEKAIKLDKELSSCNEILISREILEDKMDRIKNLQLRLKELETEHTYQMRHNDAIHSLKTKDIQSEYCHAVEAIKIKNEQMIITHIQEINNITNQAAKMKVDHEVFVEKLEESYNEKLIVEYKKYMILEEQMHQMLKGQQEQYEALKKAKSDSEETITNNYLALTKEKDGLIDELKEKMMKLIKEHEFIKQQIEDDCDREIYQLKTSHEKNIREEQDLNVRLRGEAAVLKKNLLATQKESDDFKHHVFVLQNEHLKLKSVINGMEKQINGFKKDIVERDSTIEDKEKRIFQLTSKNEELEKFKCLLDFKIKELKSQIEPRERTIQEQVMKIKEMAQELKNLQKIVLNLNSQVAEGREKLGASISEVRKEMEKNRIMKKALQEIRMDIHYASEFIQNVPVLQKLVKKMYHKYDAGKDFEVMLTESTETKNEFLRQRDFLERTVAALNAQANKNTNKPSFDKVRLVEENATLLVGTNQLSKNLQSNINQNEKRNPIIEIPYMISKEPQNKLNLAASTTEDIYNKYRKTINKNSKAIEALVAENNRLLNKITEYESDKVETVHLKEDKNA
ncbi:cilia- and flagella-associated protein 57 [Euwallacea fornicatus]|uniref:cilia- and flagella-associated protein 57 n=1 Tax=Euwallacea fornicatus TaxID=995702 RepID=UPI00338D789D